MADKIFEDGELLTKRFACACLYPYHSLDLNVEYADNGKRFVECSFEFSVSGKAPFKYRLKQIWNLICGREGALYRDYILDKEKNGKYNVLRGRDGLESLKRQIEAHYLREAEIGMAVLTADFTDEEQEEFLAFLKEHPFHKFMEEVRQWQSQKI